MKKKILFLGFHRDYHKMEIDSLYELKKIDVETYCLPNYILFLLSKLRFISKFLFYYSVSVYLNLRLMASIKKYDLVVMMDDMKYVYFMSKVNVKKTIIFRDTYERVFDDYIKDFRLYSFDKNDCIKYGLLKYNQYCSGYEYLKKNRMRERDKYDLLFVGLDKGRLKKINIVQLALDKFCLKIIIPGRVNNLVYILKKMKLMKNDRLMYKDYLDLVLSSRVLLEIVKEEQTNESMRFIEALVSGKKILTNNSNLVKHELFEYSKVKIVNFDNVNETYSTFNELLSEDNYHYDNYKLEKYSPKYVIGNIINDSLGV